MRCSANSAKTFSANVGCGVAGALSRWYVAAMELLCFTSCGVRDGLPFFQSPCCAQVWHWWIWCDHPQTENVSLSCQDDVLIYSRLGGFPPRPERTLGAAVGTAGPRSFGSHSARRVRARLRLEVADGVALAR